MTPACWPATGTCWCGGGTPPRSGHVRIGYARASTVRQSLDTQADSLRAAGVTRIFAEKISTREMRASGVAVTIVVHEHKRLGRGIELAALAEQLRAAGIGRRGHLRDPRAVRWLRVRSDDPARR